MILIDPRAGHGSGIGGLKRDFEVGVAMRKDHPLYIVIFFPEAAPTQGLADALHALRCFIEEAEYRHPGKAPALHGDCQVRSAVALLAAGCGGLAGAAVPNGSMRRSAATN